MACYHYIIHVINADRQSDEKSNNPLNLHIIIQVLPLLKYSNLAIISINHYFSSMSMMLAMSASQSGTCFTPSWEVIRMTTLHSHVGI